jgi:branched-chain amino acid transport system permease protein
MQVTLELVFTGLALGAVYCVFALGLSMVYGIARVLNFAHGSLYMLGAYLAWVLTVGYLSLPWPLVFVVLIPVLYCLGVGFERLIIRPLRWQPNWKVTTMMVTLGVAFVIDNFHLIFYGPGDKVLPPLVEGRTTVLGVVVSNHMVAVFLIAITVVIALDRFLQHSRTGQAMRAVAQDMQGAGMVGIRVNRVFGQAFGLSLVLAGLAGVLLAPVYLVSPFGGWAPFLKAFVIVVVGGLGSMRGTMYAAFLLGMVEAFVLYHVGAAWTMPIWLLTLLAILIVRPQGLLGKWAQ